MGASGRQSCVSRERRWPAAPPLTDPVRDGNDGEPLHLRVDDAADRLVREMVHPTGSGVGRSAPPSMQGPGHCSYARGSALIEDDQLALPKKSTSEAEQLALALAEGLFVNDERFELVRLDQEGQPPAHAPTPGGGRALPFSLELTSLETVSIISTLLSAAQISSSVQSWVMSRLSRTVPCQSMGSWETMLEGCGDGWRTLSKCRHSHRS